MVHVSRTFRVEKPADDVVEYMKDFSNAVEWDPGTQRCDRIDDGPVHVGSTWRNVSKFLGRESELTYTLEQLNAGRIGFVGRNKTVTSRDTIAVRSVGAGSEITYHVDVDIHGAARFGAPVIRLEFERLATKTQRQLQDVLSRR